MTLNSEKKIKGYKLCQFKENITKYDKWHHIINILSIYIIRHFKKGIKAMIHWSLEPLDRILLKVPLYVKPRGNDLHSIVELFINRAKPRVFCFFGRSAFYY